MSDLGCVTKCIEYTPLAHVVKVLVQVRCIVTLGSSQLLRYLLNKVYLTKVFNNNTVLCDFAPRQWNVE